MSLGSFTALPAVKSGGNALSILTMRYAHGCISEAIAERLESTKIFSTNGIPFVIVADISTSEALLRDLPRFAKSLKSQWLPDSHDSDEAARIWTDTSVLICFKGQLMVANPPVPYTLFFAKFPDVAHHTAIKALLERVARSGMCKKAYFCTKQVQEVKRERRLRECLEKRDMTSSES